MTTQEMDLCWVWSAGVDPVEVLEQHPGRFRQFHVKDMTETGQPTYPGTGVIDFNRIFAAAAKTQEIDEYVIEQDASAAPTVTAQQGWDLLAAARFACPASGAGADPAPGSTTGNQPTPGSGRANAGGTGSTGSAGPGSAAALAGHWDIGFNDAHRLGCSGPDSGPPPEDDSCGVAASHGGRRRPRIRRRNDEVSA